MFLINILIIMQCPTLLIIYMAVYTVAASELGSIHFKRPLQLLKDLILHWKSGDEVAIVQVDEG